ncbi:hypothetical protein [Phycicoccus sp. Root563]|uniref:hypothetical protein n=1 Tax=Phycicoccus sp. Root563 TaxID=1736562 RepID=UPI000B139250|nr:hypothetical protein [Phycicoccus sp. Root563]
MPAVRPDPAGLAGLTALKGSTGTQRAAGVVIAAFVLATAYLVVPGGLYIDDFRAQAYATGRGIWPFIVESNRTHLSPGARTVDWLQATYWPLAHGPAAVVTLVVAAALGVALWRLLELLVPDRRAALVGLSLGLFGTSIVPALAWYRQALTTLVALTCVLVAVDAALRVVRGGRLTWAAVCVGATALGLCFSERALVVAVVAAAGVLLYSTSGPRLQRLRRALVLLAPLAGVNLLFLAFYGSGEYDHASTGSPSAAGFVASTMRSVFVNTVPGLLGGPLVWRTAGPTYSFATTPAWFVVVSLVAVAAVLLLAFLVGRKRAPSDTRERPWRVFVLVLSYVLPVYVLVYVGRVSRADVRSVDDLRLYSDVSVLLAVFLAAALGAVLTGRSTAGTASTTSGATSARRTRRLARAGLVAALAVGVCFATSWSRFAVRWHTSTNTQYVDTLAKDLATNRAPIIPTPVPDSVVPAWVQPDFSSASLVALLHPDTETVRLDSTPRIVDRDGHLVTARLKAVATAINEREDFCGNGLLAGSKTVTVRFANPVPYYRGALLQMRLLVSDTTRVSATVTGDTGVSSPVVAHGSPELQRGPHMVAFPLPPNVRVSSLTLSRSRPDSGVCITGASVVVAEKVAR